MKIFNTFIFLLLCSGCGNTNEPATSTETVTNTETSSITEPVINTEPSIDTENKAIEAIKALRGKVDLDDKGKVILVDFIWL